MEWNLCGDVAQMGMYFDTEYCVIIVFTHEIKLCGKVIGVQKLVI